MSKVDNYIQYLNAFYSWESQHRLTHVQQCIMLRILHKFNQARWQEWIKIPNWELMLELGIKSDVTFRSNRDKLIHLGLIKFVRGKSSQKPSLYKLNMPVRKETIWIFENEESGEQQGKKNNGVKKLPELKNNIDTNVVSNVVTNVVTSRKPTKNQGFQDALKNKKENNKSIIRNINITHNTTIAQSDKSTHEQMNEDIMSLFNKICSNLPKVTKLSKKRTQLLAKLFKAGYTQQEFKQVFEMANNSDFLCGKTANSTFRANFDWILNENNFIKVLEGNYANFGNQNLSDGINQERKPSYDIDEHRRDCQNALMRSRSSGTFLETLKEEYEKPEHIEVEVT